MPDTTVKELVHAFLHFMKALVLAGEQSPVNWDEYKRNVDIIVEQHGNGCLAVAGHLDYFARLKATELS